MTNSNQIFRCEAGIGQCVRGIALCANDNFSARYDLDRIRGIFSRPTHKLYGESYVEKVLVLNTAKGGVASSWMLLDMVSRGMAPVALVSELSEPDHGAGSCFCQLDAHASF